MGIEGASVLESRSQIEKVVEIPERNEQVMPESDTVRLLEAYTDVSAYQQDPFDLEYVQICCAVGLARDPYKVVSICGQSAGHHSVDKFGGRVKGGAGRGRLKDSGWWWSNGGNESSS